MIKPQVKLHNRFDFEFYDTKNGETLRAHAENIVVNSLFTQRLVGSNSWFYYISVGTGTGELSVSRSNLFSLLMHKAVIAVEDVYDTDTTAHSTKRAVFTESEAIGVWTEVGIYSANMLNYLCTHALISDSEGNPISINKTNTMIVTIYATVYSEALPPLSGSYHESGSWNVMVGWPLMIASADAIGLYGMKTIDGKIAKSSIVRMRNATWNQDLANYRRYSSPLTFGTTMANRPIRGMAIIRATPNEQGYATSYSGSAGGIILPHPLFLSKDYTSIGIGTGDGATTEYDFPLDLIIPESETIYLGGVAQARGVDYTIHYGMKSTSTGIWDGPDGGTSGYAQGPIDEIVEIPQPSGLYFNDGASTITKVEIKNDAAGSGYPYSTYDLKLSHDGAIWVNLRSGSWGSNGVITCTAFPHEKYKYLKIVLTHTLNDNRAKFCYLRIWGTPPTQKQIKFTSPPANGAAITADFSIDYINKTSNSLLDVAMDVMFGRG